jgi:hypothetical protein
MFTPPALGQHGNIGGRYVYFISRAMTKSRIYDTRFATIWSRTVGDIILKRLLDLRQSAARKDLLRELIVIDRATASTQCGHSISLAQHCLEGSRALRALSSRSPQSPFRCMLYTKLSSDEL